VRNAMPREHRLDQEKVADQGSCGVCSGSGVCEATAKPVSSARRECEAGFRDHLTGVTIAVRTKSWRGRLAGELFLRLR
jgi:hypothetical protein